MGIKQFLSFCFSKLLCKNGSLGTLLLLLLFPLLIRGGEEIKPPHIIFIFVDDMGWNDVSFHGASDIPTPNIDALALNGVILNNYYGQWSCTPSRGALLSGKYPMRLGLQHFAIKGGEATALPLEVPIMPQFLKLRGYHTHLIGKWHLGSHRKIYMPTYRGFDTFFGYSGGQIDYYDYTCYGPSDLPNQPVYFGRDLYNGTTTYPESHGFRGRYATNVFAEQATNIIQNHDTSKPLFLLVSHLAIHVSNANQRLQAPPEIISKFKYIKDVNRRIHAAKLWVLDQTVGTVFEALQRKGMLQNSIFLVVSDNGGSTLQSQGGYSSNYPLRGQKGMYWEGGVRVPAVVWSPLLKLAQPRVSQQLMHGTDWMPTLYDAAGGNTSDLGKIDGLSMWQAFAQNLPSPRKEVLNAMDPEDGSAAFRMGDFKIINGSASNRFTNWFGSSGSDTAEEFHDWSGPTGSENIGQPASFYEWIFRNGSVVRDILVENGWWIAEQPDEVYEAAKVSCGRPLSTYRKCNGSEAPCLYNILEDPCEYDNLAEEFPQVVEYLMSRVNEFSNQQMAPQSKPCDPRADPMCHNFAFVPWLDPEHYTECDYAS